MNQSVMSRIMTLSEIIMDTMPGGLPSDNLRNDISPNDVDVNTGRGILVHNKQHLHTFTVHGVEIQAPNLKAARKIYNRTKRK